MKMYRVKWGLLGIVLIASMLMANNSVAQVVSFATNKPGSIFHTMGTVISKVATEKAGIRMLVQPYGSGRATMTAINSRDADFGLADANEAITAVTGQHVYKGNPLPGIRLAANIRAVPVGLFVREDTGMRTMADLKGKRLPSEYPAFPNAIPLLEGILAASGMTFNDIIGVPTPSLIPAVNDFIAGKMDAGFFAVGGPKVAEANSAVGGIRFVSVPNTPQALTAMQKVRPAYYILEVKPAPHLAGVLEPTPMLTFDQVLVVGSHVSDDLVYKVMKVIAENKKALVQGFRPFATFQPKRMGKKFTGITSHPGAIKLLKEKGF